MLVSGGNIVVPGSSVMLLATPTKQQQQIAPAGTLQSSAQRAGAAATPSPSRFGMLASPRFRCSIGAAVTTAVMQPTVLGGATPPASRSSSVGTTSQRRSPLQPTSPPPTVVPERELLAGDPTELRHAVDVNAMVWRHYTDAERASARARRRASSAPAKVPRAQAAVPPSTETTLAVPATDHSAANAGTQGDPTTTTNAHRPPAALAGTPTDAGPLGAAGFELAQNVSHRVTHSNEDDDSPLPTPRPALPTQPHPSAERPSQQHNDQRTQQQPLTPPRASTSTTAHEAAATAVGVDILSLMMYPPSIASSLSLSPLSPLRPSHSHHQPSRPRASLISPSAEDSPLKVTFPPPASKRGGTSPTRPNDSAVVSTTSNATAATSRLAFAASSSAVAQHQLSLRYSHSHGDAPTATVDAAAGVTRGASYSTTRTASTADVSVDATSASSSDADLALRGCISYDDAAARRFHEECVHELWTSQDELETALSRLTVTAAGQGPHGAEVLQLWTSRAAQLRQRIRSTVVLLMKEAAAPSEALCELYTDVLTQLTNAIVDMTHWVRHRERAQHLEHQQQHVHAAVATSSGTWEHHESTHQQQAGSDAMHGRTSLAPLPSRVVNGIPVPLVTSSIMTPERQHLARAVPAYYVSSSDDENYRQHAAAKDVTRRHGLHHQEDGDRHAHYHHPLAQLRLREYHAATTTSPYRRGVTSPAKPPPAPAFGVVNSNRTSPMRRPTNASASSSPAHQRAAIPPFWPRVFESPKSHARWWESESDGETYYGVAQHQHAPRPRHVQGTRWTASSSRRCEERHLPTAAAGVNRPQSSRRRAVEGTTAMTSRSSSWRTAVSHQPYQHHPLDRYDAPNPHQPPSVPPAAAAASWQPRW